MTLESQLDIWIQRLTAIAQTGLAFYPPMYDRERYEELLTLAAETKGNRPGFSTAAPPADGQRLYEHFAAEVEGHGVKVARGVFGADMKVSLVNDGPVTIWLDTEK